MRFTRMATSRLQIEVINNDGELLKLSATPEELMTVMKTLDTLNSDGQFSIHRIYAYGETEELKVIENIREMRWRPTEA